MVMLCRRRKMRRPAKVSYSFVPSSSSTYACPGTSLVQRMVSCVSDASVTHGPALMPCACAMKGSATRMLRSANRFIGLCFKCVNLRKLLDFSKGCLAGPSAEGIYFSGRGPKNQIPSAIATPTHRIQFHSNLVIQTILSVIWPKSCLRSHALTI